jgi:hypothetical protein
MKNSRIRYRPGAPGGARRRLPANGPETDKWGFPYASRTLHRLPGAPLSVKKGGNEEQMPGSPRTLRKLPCSIADGGAD